MKNFITLAILSFAISIFANGSIPSPPYTLYTLVSLDDYVLLEDPENPGTFVKDSDLGYNVGVSIYFYHTENGPDEDEPGDMTLLMGPLFGSGSPFPPWAHEFKATEDDPYWCTDIAHILTIPPGWQWESTSLWKDMSSNCYYREGHDEFEYIMGVFKFYLSD
jgi:hypothetical protein